jgi:hypothetical protein
LRWAISVTALEIHKDVGSHLCNPMVRKLAPAAAFVVRMPS